MLTIFLAAALAPPSPPETPPKQIAGSISDADYPAEAIRQGAQGTTGIRITVTPTGNVSGCEIERSSGSAVLDTASCALVTARFRYEPARTASGSATTAVVTRSITWRMPTDDAVGQASLPLMNFTSGLLRVTLGGVATERPRCAAEAIGTTFELQLPMQCFGFEQAPLAELSKAPLRIVTSLRLQPEGAAPAPPSDVAGGTLVSASAATIEVDPEGRIIQCTPVSLSNPGSLGETPAHLCDNLFPGMPAFVAPGGSANRRAAYQFEIFKIGGEEGTST